MTNVVVGSMFRDAAPYLDDYVHQIAGLRNLLEDRGDSLRWIAVENDSTDDTLKMLDERTHSFVDSHLIPVHDECPYFPSLDMPERWRHHAWVQNHVLENLEEDDDVLLYVESDLVWAPDDMLHLIDRTDRVTGNKAWTGACYQHELDGRWYDTWGATLNGRKFQGRMAPYHPEWTGQPMRVDTCASVLACPADLAARTRFSPTDAFKGWCRDIYDHGGEVWLDPKIGVVHP